MRVTETDLPEVLIIEPKVFGDSRGFFLETWQQTRYEQYGIPVHFTQDNLSFSTQGVLRGLHLQNPNQQGKLISVVAGEVFDVAVDVRVGSPNFGKWIGVVLSGDNHKQLWIPAGFAHGFCVLSETVYFTYKCTDHYSPDTEIGICWDDPDIGISWPLKNIQLSEKDKKNHQLRDISKTRLPNFRS